MDLLVGMPVVLHIQIEELPVMLAQVLKSSFKVLLPWNIEERVEMKHIL